MTVVKEFEAPLQRAGFALDLPATARALSIHPPFNPVMAAVLLVALDTSAPTQRRTFHWRPSGIDATGIGRYVGSMTLGGVKFLHLFEEEA